ncbi:CHAT domain-containing protein [Cercophora scortea]|uniref:CHAT domain-containing protein n=1 Tax=Cercophora scortea TaxID=314031 RepID=A0AAE0M8B6_9PEZI|nr:CHAT domain-containing protein [Cercophora scortea]
MEHPTTQSPIITATRPEPTSTEIAVSLSELRRICDMKDGHDLENLRGLSQQSYQAFLESGSAADLVAAIEFSALALNCLPDTEDGKNVACRFEMLVQKWNMLQWCYEKTGIRYYLSLALQQCANALNATPTNTQGRCEAWLIAGRILLSKFDIDGTRSDLENAIKAFESARQLLVLGMENATDSPAASGDAPANRRIQIRLKIAMAECLDLKAEREERVDQSFEGLLLAVEAYQGTDPIEDLRIDAAACLASRYFARAAQSESWLDAAIDLMDEALDLCPGNHARYPDLVNSYCDMVLIKYRRKKHDGSGREDISRAIRMAKEAIAAVSPNSVTRIKLLHTLLSMLGVRYQDIGEPDDLDNALQWAHELHHRTCWREQHLLFRKARYKALVKLEEFCLLKLKNGLAPDPTVETLMHFARKESGRLERSLIDWESRSKSTPKEHESGDTVWWPFDEGDIRFVASLEEGEKRALRQNEPAVDTQKTEKTSENQNLSERMEHVIFGCKGKAFNPFKARSQVAADGSGFSEPEAENFNPEDEFRQILAQMEELRIQDVPEALVYPDGYVTSGPLWLLLLALQQRCLKSEEVFDKVCAWLSEHAPLQATEKPRSPDRLQVLSFLGRMLSNRYHGRNEIGALNKSVEVWSAILDSTSGPYDPYRCRALYEMADTLQTRFLVECNVEDLRRALSAGEEGIGMSTPDGSLRDDQWGLLGSLYMMRFEHFGTIADLMRAIDLFGECAMIRLPDDPSRWLDLLDLSKALSGKYQHGGTELDLEQAIAVGRIALAASPMSDSLVPVINLAGFSLLKFEATEDRYYLDKGIEIFQFANRFPQDFASRFHLEVNLARALVQRYMITGDFGDVRQAIQMARHMIRTTTNDRSYRVETMRLCGEIAALDMSKQETMRSNDAVEEGTASLEELTYTDAAPVLDRIFAARQAAQIHVRAAAADKAFILLHHAVNLMQLLSPRWMEDPDRQFVLSRVSGLAEDAAALAFIVGRPAADAAAILESGRGVVLGSVLDGRDDVSQLLDLNPNLYARFETLRNQLFRSDWSDLDETVSLATESSKSSRVQRRQVAEQYDAVLREIRSIDPKLARFQLPLDFDEMKELAKDGYIVIVLESQLLEQTFAIIISQGGILHLKLDLQQVLVSGLVPLFRHCADADLRTMSQSGQVMSAGLAILWKQIVGPVVSCIEDLQARDRSLTKALPRIWWIACGTLSQLPLHAAHPTDGPGCMHRAISSYVPTLRTLRFAREGQLSFLQGSGARVGIYYMDQTPGYRDLDGVEDEADELYECLRPVTEEVVKVRQPSAAGVLQTIHSFDMVHFACHGESDPEDPSRSCLIFAKKRPRTGNGCHVDNSYTHADRLTVRDIIRETARSSSRKTGILFLSGCSTADNPASHLGDECIHLATAYHLAGFSHVVGTLWDAVDSACVQVASEFYTSLFAPPPCRADMEEIDPSLRIAASYQRAVLQLMEDQENPIVWAAFVYYGA